MFCVIGGRKGGAAELKGPPFAISYNFSQATSFSHLKASFMHACIMYYCVYIRASYIAIYYYGEVYIKVSWYEFEEMIFI